MSTASSDSGPTLAVGSSASLDARTFTHSASHTSHKSQQELRMREKRAKHEAELKRLEEKVSKYSSSEDPATANEVTPETKQLRELKDKRNEGYEAVMKIKSEYFLFADEYFFGL